MHEATFTRQRSLLFVCSLALVACGGSEAAPEAPAPEPAPPASAAAPAAPPPAAAPERTPAERCEALITRHWSEVEAALRELGATELDEARERYTRQMGVGYRRSCEALPADRFECLERAERSLDALGDCGTNQEIELTSQLRPMSMTWFVPALLNGDSTQGRSAPPEADQRALLSSVTGTWARGEDRIRFAADGAITVEGRQAGSYTGRVVARNMIRGEGERPRTFVVLRAGDDLFVGSSYQTQPHPIAEDGHAVLFHQSAIFLARDLSGASPSCSGYTEYGRRLSDVSCAFEGEGDARTLVLRYRLGRDIDGSERANESRAVFRLREGHLVPDTESFWYSRA